MARLKPLLALSFVAQLGACAGVEPRPAQSSYGCMQAVVQQLPESTNDKHLHCLAGAGIARQCSVVEAYLAGIGKELRDMFGAGDPEWADWQADRAGIRCARESATHADIEECCTRRGY